MHHAEAGWDGLVPPTWGGSTFNEMPTHSVMHSSWEDAKSYCDWKGTRLPTVAEFEPANRGGLEGPRRARGNEFIPQGVHQASMWQGTFPHPNRDLEASAATAR